MITEQQLVEREQDLAEMLLASMIQTIQGDVNEVAERAGHFQFQWIARKIAEDFTDTYRSKLKRLNLL